MNRFCQYCGCQIRNNYSYCENCGNPVNNNIYNNNQNTYIKEENTFLWGLLGFFVPIGGLVIFLLWLKEKPKTARSAGLGALIRAILTGFMIFFFIIGMIFSIAEDEDRENNEFRNPYHEIFDEDDWT